MQTIEPQTATSKMGQPSWEDLPVTIITGFLGSGKTTLLNHILTQQGDLKIALLVNEFGEIGIDNELIRSTEDDMVELNNGCICCTINDDLIKAVYNIWEKRDRVDYIIVETTGVADPMPVAMTFLATELADMTRLDSIVSLVDCENFSLDIFEDSQTAYSQIAYGDIILLNKADLVEPAAIDKIEERIHSIREDARILRTTNAQVPLPLILSVGLFQSDRYFQQEEGEHHEHHHHHEHDEHHHHSHDGAHHDRHEHHDRHHSHHLDNDGFMSLSFQTEKPFDLRKFQYFLDNQLPTSIFRAKGVLWFDESPLRHIFHLSGRRFTLEDDVWYSSLENRQMDRKNQLVFIGRDFDPEQVRSQLADCVIDGTI